MISIDLKFTRYSLEWRQMSLGSYTLAMLSWVWMHRLDCRDQMIRLSGGGSDCKIRTMTAPSPVQGPYYGLHSPNLNNVWGSDHANHHHHHSPSYLIDLSSYIDCDSYGDGDDSNGDDFDDFRTTALKTAPSPAQGPYYGLHSPNLNNVWGSDHANHHHHSPSYLIDLSSYIDCDSDGDEYDVDDFDQDLREATHDDAVRVLKNTGGQVTWS